MKPQNKRGSEDRMNVWTNERTSAARQTRATCFAITYQSTHLTYYRMAFSFVLFFTCVNYVWIVCCARTYMTVNRCYFWTNSMQKNGNRAEAREPKSMLSTIDLHFNGVSFITFLSVSLAFCLSPLPLHTHIASTHNISIRITFMSIVCLHFFCWSDGIDDKMEFLDDMNWRYYKIHVFRNYTLNSNDKV